jgi:hypothetical protein
MTLAAARLRQVAIEEAAHTVCALRLGWSVSSASALPSQYGLGHAILLPRQCDEPLVAAIEHMVISFVGALCVEAVAQDDSASYGMERATVTVEDAAEIAASEYAGTFTGYGVSSDRDKIEQHAHTVCETPAEQATLIAFARARAMTLIDDPTFTRDVLTLAETLERVGSISWT